MLVASRIFSHIYGKTTEFELRGLVYAGDEIVNDLRELMGHRLKALEGTWLQRTLMDAPIKPKYPFEVPSSGLPWFKRPVLWACLYLAIASFLLFVVFW